MGTVLTRDEIFAIDDRVIEWVDVPEWTKDPKDPKGVFVQSLSGTDRDSFEFEMIEYRNIGKGKTTPEMNLRNLRAKLVARTAVTSDDPATAIPIFTLQDVATLGRKNAGALQRIYKVSQRLSGLSAEDEEELTNGLGEGQSGASGSDSPSPLGTEASPMLSAGSLPASSPSGSPSIDSNPSATDG